MFMKPVVGPTPDGVTIESVPYDEQFIPAVGHVSGNDDGDAKT